MTGEPIITVTGNLTGDPELRFTPSGAAVANFTVASTPRSFNRQTNAWDDGTTLFMRCSVWRDMAEHVAESLTRGTRVVVTGRLVSNSYETKEGEKRTTMELQVDEVGPSLRYATAKVVKTERQQPAQGGQQGSWGQQGAQPDPWASAPAQGQQQPQTGPQGQQQGGWTAPAGQPAQGGWGAAPTYDEPPF